MFQSDHYLTHRRPVKSFYSNCHRNMLNVVKITSSGLLGAGALAGALAASGASAKTGGVIGFSVGIISALFIGNSLYNTFNRFT